MMKMNSVAELAIVNRDHVEVMLLEHERLDLVVSVGEPTPKTKFIAEAAQAFFVPPVEEGKNVNVASIKEAFRLAHEKWREGKCVLFHCLLGKTRSPLLALFCLADYYAPDGTDRAYAQILALGKERGSQYNRFRQGFEDAASLPITYALMQALGDEGTAHRLARILSDDPYNSFKMLEARRSDGRGDFAQFYEQALRPTPDENPTAQIREMRERYLTTLNHWAENADDCMLSKIKVERGIFEHRMLANSPGAK